MDLPEVVSVRKFRELSAKQKDNVYDTLMELASAVEDLPKKSLRKTLDLALAVLQYKGQQVKDLEEQLEDNETETPRERLVDENEKLKRMLGDLEEEKQEYKQKIKELNEDILSLQKRLHEVAANAEASDQDSSDPLSELDKQETLLRNINTKNKHIKRLLREIESLQNQNIEQSKTILTLEKDLQHSKDSTLQLRADLTLLESEKRAHKESIQELNIEIKRLEGKIIYLEEQRANNEKEVKDFMDKLERKAMNWKKIIEEKDKQLLQLKDRNANMNTERDTSRILEENTESEDTDEQEEKTKLLHTLECRDKLIEQMEAKIKTMAEEMMASTKLMNKITAEREQERNPHNPRSCCKSIESALKAANDKCRDLSDMLEKAEEEAALKAKEALDACSALAAYQRGEDGLVTALRKNATLDAKVQSRDKQIHALVMELNSMHEIVQENTLLRKRLNIPDDVVITTKNLSAKERCKEKMIEKLTLKLRASEEMRLQLKMEKSDLRKALFDLQQHYNVIPSGSTAIAPATEPYLILDSPAHSSHNSPDKSAKTASNQSHQSHHSCNSSNELGEVVDSTSTSETEASLRVTLCSHCQGNPKIELIEKGETELQMKYCEVMQDNEVLRQGMFEILEQLTEFQDSSDSIKINDELLQRLIRALSQEKTPQSSPQSRAEHGEVSKEATSTRPSMDTMDEDTSIESVREMGEIRDLELPLEMPKHFDSSTRPTTPNKSIKLPNIASPEIVKSPPTADNRVELEELRCYKKYYEELKLHMNSSELEALQNYAQITDKLMDLELKEKRDALSFLYMKQDLDKCLTDLKQQELKHIEKEGALKQEIANLKESLEKLNQDISSHKSHYLYSRDDYQNLQNSLHDSQMQLAFLSEHILGGKIDPQLKVPELCMDYGIIQDDLQLEFISRQEYEMQKRMLSEFDGQKSELQRKISQLESLLQIAQDQIASQQRLLNDITDNHINLRHLVADLQSSTEEKLVLAKFQRDLDEAKSEISHLKHERDSLRLMADSLQLDVVGRDQLHADALKNFQIERQNSHMKIKYLQKSLDSLREKYAKFTPLVFLTNFVFAYNKFLDKSATNTSSKDGKDMENLQQTIDDTVRDVLKVKLDEIEESEQLIRLIKSETQCKMFNDHIKQLERRCSDLDKELNEMRIKMATEHEHWQTIEALFGGEKPQAGRDNGNTEAVVVSTRDIGCNTEMEGMLVVNGATAASTTTTISSNAATAPATAAATSPPAAAASAIPTPIPAARRLSAKDVKKASIEMVDKNVSPIASPERKMKIAKATQTLDMKEDDYVKSPKSKENSESIGKDNAKQQTYPTMAAKQTSEAQIQTISELANLATKSVQTMEEQNRSLEADPDQKLKDALEKCQRMEESLCHARQEIAQLKQDLEKAKITQHSSPHEQSLPSLQTDVIEKTILSFHSLLSEKDKSIGKYQDLLQSEREHAHLNATKLSSQVEDLKSTITNLNFNIKAKDLEILELKSQLDVVSLRRNSHEKIDLASNLAAVGCGTEENVDNSLNEMTDEKIEEMFEENLTQSTKGSPVKLVPGDITEKHELEQVNDMASGNYAKQLKELKEKASYWESCLKVKEDEISIMREKIRLLEDREKVISNVHNPEMDQLRSLLEDKDRHINELMDTLNNFHEDQRRYMNDSSNFSADQITKLASDLSRTEATNKIYQAQVEAMRRQLTSLTQREKQARELNQSLRQQLIKRPVVSIKTELNARVKNENLQKRVQQLELDLEDARVEIQRQKNIIESKRARSANEVGLWEKQKRWQQNAEKYKAKLEESEIMLEKTRSLLQAARTTINRLEKDKQILQAKLGRVTHHNVQNAMKCCRTPSCPNLHHQSTSGNCGGGGKYTPSESPETYTAPSSECSSPGRSSLQPCPPHFVATSASMQNPHSEIIETLKARIEMQQRKILAMELQGKGSNALTTEVEKLQEKLSAAEAQNIRLEARNLQLQLDNDMLRQGDGTERLQKRIKHLEDYIIALKEEMATNEARRQLCKCSGIKLNTQSGQSAEQTILSLRNLVDKLKAENRYLKDGRRSCESRASTEVSADSARLQQMYSESLDKITALQHELTKQSKCPHCEKKNKKAANNSRTDTSALQDELNYVREQLVKKTQLLQKAKMLLTRAAAKEKVLKEHLSAWKRKCSELQNVPVIEEISE